MYNRICSDRISHSPISILGVAPEHSNSRTELCISELAHRNSDPLKRLTRSASKSDVHRDVPRIWGCTELYFEVSKTSNEYVSNYTESHFGDVFVALPQVACVSTS